MAKKYPIDLFTKRTATYSPCGKYRYTLRIVWDESLPICCFIMLNPSTATEHANDPTVTRCIGFAQSWRCGGVLVLNIFAYRATDPVEMKRQDDPIGPENTLAHLWNHVQDITGPVIAAWSNHGTHRGRGDAVRAIMGDLQCLKINADGSPSHPLYLPANLKPIPFS